MGAAEEILFERRGRLAVVTLNRPKALNALSLGMCRAIFDGLGSWPADPDVQAVLVKGEGERAFCAGGDIRALYDLLKAEGPEAAAGFYAVEYPMNARLHRFRKPYVSLLDGITMGGGVGVSVHGSHRVATERTVFAMPETGIGFFPDVGATYVLPRLGGGLGLYLGLTGVRLRAADCLQAGLATHYVPAGRLPELELALAEADLSGDAHAAVDAVLERFGGDPGPAAVAELRPRIDACFDQPSLEAVLDALAREETGWGRSQLDLLASKSPTSLAVAFRQLRSGDTLDFDAAMRLEYRLVHRFMAGHDFREGVRALLVDKDNTPAWRPARLQDVSVADLDAYFAPLPHGDLPLSA
jgi:enoyl-CoA hydratase